MKAMKASLILAGLLAVSCSPAGSKNIQPTSADAKAAGGGGGFGALEAEAKVCGVHLMRRGVDLWAATEICGGKWHALGMQKQAAEVYIRHGASAPYDQSKDAAATVSYDAAGNVSIVHAGTPVKLGQLAGNVVKPLAGINVEIVVKGRPYQVGDSKATPEADKAIFVTLAQ